MAIKLNIKTKKELKFVIQSLLSSISQFVDIERQKPLFEQRTYLLNGVLQLNLKLIALHNEILLTHDLNTLKKKFFALLNNNMRFNPSDANDRTNFIYPILTCVIAALSGGTLLTVQYHLMLHILLPFPYLVAFFNNHLTLTYIFAAAFFEITLAFGEIDVASTFGMQFLLSIASSFYTNTFVLSPTILAASLPALGFYSMILGGILGVAFLSEIIERFKEFRLQNALFLSTTGAMLQNINNTLVLEQQSKHDHKIACDAFSQMNKNPNCPIKTFSPILDFLRPMSDQNHQMSLRKSEFKSFNETLKLLKEPALARSLTQEWADFIKTGQQEVLNQVFLKINQFLFTRIETPAAPLLRFFDKQKDDVSTLTTLKNFLIKNNKIPDEVIEQATNEAREYRRLAV